MTRRLYISLSVNGVALQCVDSVMDLWHAISYNDKDSMVTAAKASFWCVFNFNNEWNLKCN